MKEENYIQIMIRHVEEKTGWGNSDEWTNYNFSLLSEEIKNATGKRISESTLKRIFGKKKTQSSFYNPHIYTKNILAEYTGYQNWDEFRKESCEKIPECKESSGIASRSKMKGFFYITGLSVLILFIFFLSFMLIQKNSFTGNPLIKMDVKEDVGSVPFTAIFNYELRNTKDSVLIDFGNNEVFFLSPSRNMITQFYPGADFTTVEVSRKGKLISSQKIHLLSSGWQSGFSPNDSLYAYRPFEDQKLMLTPGRLFISPEDLENTPLTGDETGFVEFRYFDLFDIPVDEIELHTRIKNSPEEGGKRCYDAEIIMKGENSDFVVRFLEPGCFRYVRFNVGEKKYFGRFHDLSAFARDISDWRDVRIRISKGEAKVYFEDELIRTETYSEKMGELKGIIYRFYGNGSVDYVRIAGKDSIILEDDF